MHMRVARSRMLELNFGGAVPQRQFAFPLDEEILAASLLHGALPPGRLVDKVGRR